MIDGQIDIFSMMNTHTLESVKAEYKNIRENYRTWTITVEKGKCRNTVGAREYDRKHQLRFLKDYGVFDPGCGCAWRFRYEDVKEIRGIEKLTEHMKKYGWDYAKL